jgi:murein DD-endopeptidase MepM/ murein hydrolase activator NlpD
MRIKNFISNKYKLILSVALVVILLQSFAITHLYLNKNVENYEVNLVKINTEKDSIDANSLKNSLVKVDDAVKNISSFLSSKSITNVKIETLKKDSLSNTVYLSKISNRYSQYLVDLQNQLQSLPLGKPSAGYISSNFGWRKNPIPPKENSKTTEVETTYLSEGDASFKTDSAGNKVVVKKKKEIPMQHHNGVDLAVPYGSDIFCTAKGKVIFAGQKSGYGTCVIVQHENGLATLYAHLSSIVVDVNQEIKTNQLIAKSGNSGRSTGPHLHYEVRKNNQPINPKLFLNF